MLPRFREPLIAATLLGLALAACAPAKVQPRALPTAPEVSSHKVAKGYIVTVPPEGIVVGADEKRQAVKPKVTEDFEGPPTSNDWWSSLIWQFDKNEPFSFEMFPHPYTLRARADGLALGYSDKAQVRGRQFTYPYERDLVVGLAGLASPDTRVASYSDWAVTADWRTGDSRLRATFGHGLPFVFFERKGTAPVKITVSRLVEDKAQKIDAEMWSENGGVLGVTVGDHHYAFFAPTSASWTRKGDTFSSTLDGKDYFSVALLPDRKPETLKLFREHAYAFVTETRVSWTYDEKKAELTSRFEATTTLKDDAKGLSSEPLMALYRHQWLHTQDKLLPYEYVSSRGAMKLFAGNAFSTKLPFGGVLPGVPVVSSVDRGDLKRYLREVAWAEDMFPPGLSPKPERDTYWVGKSLGRVATALQLADAIGATEERDHMLDSLKNELEDWFDGQAPKLFYYDSTWKTVVGSPASYDADAALNDHHFHYGYYVQAAATIARYDAAWAKRWGKFVELLIMDAANTNREEPRFPFLRYMDAYAGHGWANGPAQYHDGNNEESSSEDMNFSTGLILWGAAMGKPALRDAGIFLFATTLTAIEQYWFDVDGATFPKGFDHPCVAIVWSNGGKYDTWWDPNPIMVHGINYLPFNGGSYYLGRHPDLVERQYATLLKRTSGAIYTWRDCILMYQALWSGKKAAAELAKEDRLAPEFGHSRALTYAWVRSLAEMGNVDSSVTADVPTYAVFTKKAHRSYVAYNPDKEPRKVTFSDGFTTEVPSRQIVILEGKTEGKAEAKDDGKDEVAAEAPAAEEAPAKPAKREAKSDSPRKREGAGKREAVEREAPAKSEMPIKREGSTKHTNPTKKVPEPGVSDD
jgi:endoglucanase Acf2